MELTSQKFLRHRAVAIVIRGEDILALHRLNQGKAYYVFPGGKIEEGETPEQAAIRECKEETSIDASIVKPLYHHIYNDESDQLFFLCKYVDGIPGIGNGEEFIGMTKEDWYEPMWIEIQDLPTTLLYPLEIRDELIQDIQKNFTDEFKEVMLEVEKLRQVL